MKYKRFDDTIVLRLEAGEDINGSLMSLAQKEKITLASVSGIGATDDFTVGVFDIESKDYNKKHYTGNHEITSLTGNITEMNGAPYVHLHITCAGKDGNIVGGHLLSARISLTAEIIIQTVGGTVDRARDEEMKINVLEL